MLKTDTTKPGGEDIAIRALLWIASDAQMMHRFLDLTGIDAGRIREAAQEPAFLAGVLNFILAHEPTLDAFAAAENLQPAAVAAALRQLPGSDGNYDQGSI